MAEILQDRLEFAPWMQAQSRRLPGVMPLAAGDWLRVDDAYGAQLALKAALLAERRDDVLAVADSARPAVAELLARVLAELATMPGFRRAGDIITRPDGVTVPIDHDDPFLTLSQLVQEDLVIMEREGDEHVLTAALLCFPASWTLTEKFMRPLTAIHGPVPEYGPDIARRVQRLFDAIRVEQPMWRANALFYEDAALYQPRNEAAPRKRPASPVPFLRSERQCLLRLPDTGAVVFSIHTTVIRRENLTPEQAAGLTDYQLEEVRG